MRKKQQPAAGKQRNKQSARMQVLKRASERRAKSFFIVIIFLVVFVCMIVTEVFYVEDERWKEERLLSMFSIRDSERFDPVDLSPRMVRELAAEVDSYNSGVDFLSANDTHSRFFGGEPGTGDETSDVWQQVANTRDKFFVFSAYYDDRRAKWVRVVAAARTRLADKVVCQYQYRDGREPVNVIATNRLIRENWNLKFSAYFVLCPVKQPESGIPTHVSIIRHGDTAISNKLVVHINRSAYKKPVANLAVCIKPLHYEYNKVQNLIEFVELNRILGVSHFVLYNHTVGPEVGCVLKNYVSHGVVTVLPWQLDIVSQKEIRTEGLFAALNDCLYRTMYRFRYVLMIDLDEYVVPHKNMSLSLMLSHLMKKSPDRTGAYSFQNAFFYLQWPNDTSAQAQPYKLLTLSKTTRKTKFHAHKQRSKCVVLPDRVVEMGNHFVWEFVSGKTMVNIPPDVGFLHHYRVCEFGGNDCVNTSHVVDRRVYTWRDPLVEAVALKLRLLQPVCQTVPKLLTSS